MADLQFVDTIPNPEEYLNLRSACGLGPRSLSAARKGLPNSLYALSVRDNDAALVGLGRVVGDGGSFAMISDIAVHPTWQRRGLGNTIMDRVMAWCQQELPETCFVSLVSNAGLSPWYEGFGFQVCPPEKPGMMLSIPARTP